MIQVFDSDEFGRYHDYSRNRRFVLDEAAAPISTEYHTVFISHKHDDLVYLADFISFLEKTYKVKAYIDSRDLSLPKITSAWTAATIKERIETCDKFILLGTMAPLILNGVTGSLGMAMLAKWQAVTWLYCR